MKDVKKEDKIMVSVIIVSYKQAKYIKEAIDSVLMQKVNFKYELILADDCSQDGTLEIMKKYEKKYPQIIKILVRNKNLGGTRNIIDAYSHASGKYITILEGDDYWCDSNKLQIQVDFLEQNDEFFAISHLQEGRNLKNEFQGNFPKGIYKDEIITGVQQFIDGKINFSVTATMHRNFYNNKQNLEDFINIRNFDPTIGDAQMNIFFCTLGKVYVMKEPMMVYRMRNNDGESNFNSSHKINQIEYRYMNIYLKLEEYYNYKYNFYKKIKYSYTLGVAYDICKFKFKDIKKFNKLCPLKYKVKIWLCFPLTCFNILFNRFIKK